MDVEAQGAKKAGDPKAKEANMSLVEMISSPNGGR
jgi:hypothetical protein